MRLLLRLSCSFSSSDLSFSIHWGWSIEHSGGNAGTAPLGSLWPSRQTTASAARSSAASSIEDSAARRWGPAMATTAAKADTGTISTTHRLNAPPDSSARGAAPIGAVPRPVNCPFTLLSGSGVAVSGLVARRITR